jgi:hypothetical protein
MSVAQWSRISFSNTTSLWIVNFLIIGIVLVFKAKYFRPSNLKDYKIITFYFIWMLIGAVRGLFVPENYWEWKQYVEGCQTLSLPIFMYIFAYPEVLRTVLKFWFKYALIIFGVFIFWIITPDAYHFYLGPVLLVACFLPVLEGKWQLIIIFFLLLMIFADFGARSQVIKAVLAITMSLAYVFSKYVSDKGLIVAHSFFYILPIALLTLGISGEFNLFKNLSKNEGKYSEKKVVNGKLVEEDLASDTRTFIYVEVIESAIRHNYVLWGRTPARGNDSVSFGTFGAEILKTSRYERHSNEVCFPNVFTWLGLIGMILYCLIYLKSSYLAVYKSNNLFMKLVGVFIAFRFLYGWIEDFNRFDIMNMTLWMFIAMGFSERFRSMNNAEFKIWVKSIF